MKKFYLTTAIDYPSGAPHIGHAYEKVLGDCLARWHRMRGEETFFATGTDEHGQKIQKYAKAAHKSPHEFVNFTSNQFKVLCRQLNISNNDFIRTTEERHAKVCHSIFQKIYEMGDIYKGKYKGLYCVDCESFYMEKDLLDGKCPVHNCRLEHIEEDSYFFKMSKYEKSLISHIQNHPEFIEPATRRNEIMNRLKDGLKDLCISRSSYTWGIPLPNDSTHVIYVWFDALLNYISILGYPGQKYEKYWPADIHIIGKDILWQHAVIWPALLMAAEMPLPRCIFVHGFINVDGEKLSKSKGVKVDLPGLIDKFGADAIRYFLIRETPYGEDGKFSGKALVKRINNDLANDLGNLLSRTLAMIEKYFNGDIPAPADTSPNEDALVKTTKDVLQKAEQRFNTLHTGEALAAIWELVNRLNKYVEESAPWNLAKDENPYLATVLYQLTEGLRITAVLLFPFMPDTAAEIWHQLGIKETIDRAILKTRLTDGKIKPHQKVMRGKHLFDKHVDEI